MFKKKILVGLIICLAWSWSETPVNLVKNGSFEDGVGTTGIPKDWGSTPYYQELSDDSYSGQYSLKISREKSDYAIGAQVIELDVPKVKKVAVLGYIKGKNIFPEKERWQGGKVQVIFLNSQNQEIGKPQDLVTKSGSFEWEMFIQSLNVPEKASKLKILLGLWGARGTVWFDSIQVYPLAEKKSKNFLSNGDFEIWGNWQFLGEGDIQIKYPGYNNSTSALYINNSRPVWSFAAQEVDLLANIRATQLVLSGMVKTKDIVPGQNKWEKGRIYLEFRNENDEMIGSWQELALFEGSTDWTRFNKPFQIPANTRKILIYLGLQNATGEIVFDDLELKPKDTNF